MEVIDLNQRKGPLVNRCGPIHLLDLPAEILCDIFSHFDNPFRMFCDDMLLLCPHWKEVYAEQVSEDTRQTQQERLRTIQNIRLVCHVFNELASPLLYADIGLNVSQVSLNFLYELAKQTYLAKSIRSITIYLYAFPSELAAELPRFRSNREKELRDFYDSCVRCRYELDEIDRSDLNIPDETLERAMSAHNDILDAWKAYFDPANDNVMSQTMRDYQQCLLKGHDDYRKLHDEQFGLLTSGMFTSGLASSLVQMPNFRSLYFKDELDLHFPTKFAPDPTVVFSSPENLRRYMGVPYEWAEAQKLNDGADLLPSILLLDVPTSIHQAGVRIRHLAMWCLPNFRESALFSSPRDDLWQKAWEDFHTACSELEIVDLHPWQDDISELQLERICEAKALLQKFLPAVLSSQSLREVSVGLRRLRFTDSASVVRFCDLGSAIGAVTWPHLRKLQLDAVAFTQHDLEELCHNLGPNMEYIHLSSLQMIEGTWSVTLTILRDKYAARCARGDCNLELRQLQGGEFDCTELKSINLLPLSSLKESGWQFEKWRGSIADQLAELYVRGKGVMENPLNGNAAQILKAGPMTTV